MFLELWETNITKQALTVYVGCWLCVTAEVHPGIEALE